MIYSKIKFKNKPESIRAMESNINAFLHNNGSEASKYLILQKLFSPNAFFNEFILKNGQDIKWIGVKIGQTHTGAFHFIIRNEIDGMETKISPEKLLRKIKNDHFTLEHRVFKTKKLKF